MAASEVLGVLDEVTRAVRSALDGLEDWGLAGTREGQYLSDLAADKAALEVLEDAGYGCISEESGTHHPERAIVVVLDPVDGSTNASRGLPWWATSVCALDESGPLAAVVVNQATGTRFAAVRGGGATRDAEPIHPSGCRSFRACTVGFSGFPRRWLGWSQYRTLGAAALDLCAVASGALDCFVDCGGRSLATWDYLGGMLICQEAGGLVVDAFGGDLVVRDHAARRTVVAAATAELLAEAVAARRSIGSGPPSGV